MTFFFVSVIANQMEGLSFSERVYFNVSFFQIILQLPLFYYFFDLVKYVFGCKGSVVDHPEYGQVIEFNGDQRENIYEFLRHTKLARTEEIALRRTRF